jgi:hypothetical protein
MSLCQPFFWMFFIACKTHSYSHPLFWNCREGQGTALCRNNTRGKLWMRLKLEIQKGLTCWCRWNPQLLCVGWSPSKASIKGVTTPASSCVVPPTLTGISIWSKRRREHQGDHMTHAIAYLQKTLDILLQGEVPRDCWFGVERWLS